MIVCLVLSGYSSLCASMHLSIHLSPALPTHLPTSPITGPPSSPFLPLNFERNVSYGTHFAPPRPINKQIKYMHAHSLFAPPALFFYPYSFIFSNPPYLADAVWCVLLMISLCGVMSRADGGYELCRIRGAVVGGMGAVVARSFFRGGEGDLGFELNFWGGGTHLKSLMFVFVSYFLGGGGGGAFWGVIIYHAKHQSKTPGTCKNHRHFQRKLQLAPIGKTTNSIITFAFLAAGEAKNKTSHGISHELQSFQPHVLTNFSVTRLMKTWLALLVGGVFLLKLIGFNFSGGGKYQMFTFPFFLFWGHHYPIFSFPTPVARNFVLNETSIS